MSGTVVTTSNGSEYVLTLADGDWTATYQPATAAVRLGTTGQTVTLVRAEDGSWWAGDQLVESGTTVRAADGADGTEFVLSLGEDGIWTASPVRGVPASDDHGNDAASATRLALNTSLAGVIEVPGDEDWFRLETSGSRDLKIRTTGSVDTVGALFDALIFIDPQRRPLAADDDGGIDANFALEATVPAGAYYLRVRAHGSGTGRYTIEEHGEAPGMTPSGEPPGTILTIAGTGAAGYSGDGGPAVDAQVALPLGVAVDSRGNLYIADTENHRVRRVDLSGTITTVAGTGAPGYSGDGGPAIGAQLAQPFGVATDAAGSVYIADTGNYVIRRVDPSGRITTVAGTGTRGDSGDGGPAVSAQIGQPWDVAVDGAGNLYIASLGSGGIRKVDPSGRIETVPGVPPAYGIAVDEAGTLYVPNVESHVIHRVAPSGLVTTVAGTGTPGYSGDSGPATSARIHSPTDVAVDRAGNLYIADTENYRVRRVDPSGLIATVAGTGTQGYSGDGGPAAAARLGGSEGILRLAVDPTGNLYIADTENHRVRKVALSQGVIGPPPPPPDDHGNDPSGATRMALNSSLGGVIETAGDEDWFRLETSGRRHLKVRTTGSLDTVGTLFDASSRQLAEDDDGGSGANFALQAEVAAGVYYVRVRAFSGSETGRYTIEEHGEAAARGPPNGSTASTPKIYWTDTGTGKIQRGNLDGSGVEDVVTGLSYPRGLALDLGGGKMYWTHHDDRFQGKIQRSNLDGSGVEDLVTGLGQTMAIALDLVAGKMYWPHLGMSTIQRSNLDGSGVETLVTGVSFPFGIALNVAGGKMYWTTEDKIRRANLDGSGAEDLVTEAVFGPRGIALDLSGGKMYWANWGGRIQRANLDGSGVEDLVTRVQSTGIALDIGRGKVYWTRSGQLIQRANLDGSGVEDVVTGLSTPYDLALDPGNQATDPVAPVRDDHGNDAANATRLALNSALGGVIETAGDEDWFRLETSGRRHLKVRTTGSLDTVGTLFDASRRLLAGDDDSGSGTNFALEAEVPAGVYYVRVQGYGPETGRYTIQEHGEAAVAAPPGVEPGTITTVAGTGERGFSGDGGPAIAARLGWPNEVAVDAAGNVYFVDDSNHRVRRVDRFGTITTVAGTGVEGFSGDGGPATAAQVDPSALAVDTAGNLYIADWNYHRVRRVDRSGTITTVAGTGVEGYSGDGGPAIAARLRHPGALAVDASGNLYIADSYNRRVRRVNRAGAITTVAGTGQQYSSGDGGPATAAGLVVPSGLAVDGAGNLYIADSLDDRVRRVDRFGTITTVAGTGVEGYSGDGGPATAAQITPVGLAVDAAGNLYIADGSNHRVRKVDRSGVITTVAGTGTRGYSGDGGPATAAQLATPYGLAVDAAGNLYIADTRNYRVRVVFQGAESTGGAGQQSTGKVYWVDAVRVGKIQRANLDGSGVEDLVTNLNAPRGLALDRGAGKMYWTEISVVNSGTLHRGKIRRANLDGSGVEALVTGLGNPFDLALDIGAGKVYWTDSNFHKIQRANLDGSGVEDLVTLTGNGPTNVNNQDGLALDIGAGKMYWTQRSSDYLFSSNLDGSGVRYAAHSGMASPDALALGAGYIYWTATSARKIQRLDLDRAGAEDLVTGVIHPSRLALDLSGSKIYWTAGATDGTDKIQRANLDGTGVEDVITGLQSGIGLAVDPGN